MDGNINKDNWWCDGGVPNCNTGHAAYKLKQRIGFIGQERDASLEEAGPFGEVFVLQRNLDLVAESFVNVGGVWVW